MLVKIVAALAVIVIGFAAFVATRPSQYRVARTVTMAAPASTVFAQVNWNPWAKIDPTMKQTYEGAPAGPGVVYTWAGNKEVGEGRMTVTDDGHREPSQRSGTDQSGISQAVCREEHRGVHLPAGE
jgi:hypothetical protein